MDVFSTPRAPLVAVPSDLHLLMIDSKMISFTHSSYTILGKCEIVTRQCYILWM